MGSLASVRQRSLLIGASLLVAVLVAVGALIAFAPNQAYASSTKNVWVVTKIVHKTSDDYEESSETNVISYNSAGLIKKFSYGSYPTVYSYDKKNRMISEKSYGSTKSIFKLDKKGRVVGFKGNKNYVQYDSNGHANKAMLGLLRKYTYSKSGLLMKMTGQGGMGDIKQTYVYDSKKQIKKYYASEAGEGYTFNIKNTYSGSKLVKRQITSKVGNDTIVYKYKRVAVPKSVLAKVKAQQRWVFTKELPYAYAPYLPSVTK